MTETLHTILKKIYYDYLPNSLRKYYGPKIDRLYSLIYRLYAAIGDLYLPVTCLTGHDADIHSQVRILIAGKENASPYFIKRLNLPELATTSRTRQGNTSLWNVSQINKGQAQAIIIEADRCFSSYLRAKGFITIPNWIGFTLDLSMPPEDILNKYKKRDWSNYRKIVRHQYSYEAVHDASMVDLFYHKMYLPYITSRHGDLSHTESLAYVKNLMHYGELLLVKENNEYVGGFMMNTAMSPPMLVYMGILDGREDYIKNGLSPAMYYFAICWAKEKGHSQLDFGHCRPFFADGVLQFKKRWGMHVHRSTKVYRALHLLPCEPHTSLSQSLLNNPFIYEDHGQLKGMLCLDQDITYSEDSIKALKKHYEMPGLKDVTAISSNNLTAEPTLKS